MNKTYGVIVGLLVLTGLVYGETARILPAGVTPSRFQVQLSRMHQAGMVDYAQASPGAAGSGGSGAAVVQTSVEHGGFGSDVTALFRFSRWRRPLAPGGIICWVNPKVWGSEPYRALTVLAGEALLVAGVYAVVEAFEDDGNGYTGTASEPTMDAPSGGSSSGSSEPSDGGSSSGGSSGDDSSSTDTGAGGDEVPF